MAPAIGIGILAFAGILFVAWLLFLAGQQKLQDDLARLLKENQEGHPRAYSDSNPLIDAWICPSCGFMSRIQSNCHRCLYPRPHNTPYLRIHYREFLEQSAGTHPVIYVPPNMIAAALAENQPLDLNGTPSPEGSMAPLNDEQGQDDQWWREAVTPAMSLARGHVQ